MMRRRSSLEPYDIDDDQTLHDYPDDGHDIGPGGLQADAKRATSSCIAINSHSSNGSGGGRIQQQQQQSAPCGQQQQEQRQRDDDDDDGDAGSNDNDTGVFSSYVPWNSRASSPTVPYERSEQVMLDAYDPASITVHMSILQELGAGETCDEAQHHPRGQAWMDSAVLWRRCPYLDDLDGVTPMVVGSPASSSYPAAAEEELELATAAADPDDERQHEERRLVERFATYKTRSNGAVGVGGGGVVGGVGGGSSGSGCGGSGSGTPKSRRRNKRKGCDSPRPPPDEPTPQTDDSPALPASAGQPQETATANGQGRHAGQVGEPAATTTNGFANFDDLAVMWRMDGRFAGETARKQECSDGTEPITSHGMRPGRAWADDDDDDEVTVSPRVMSPELDEPAGSLHVRALHRRCNEPQERRTTFVALGTLNTMRSSSPMVVQESSDENPATQRARQLVQFIQSLKEKVKLYEDAFEQRYGYRPSHHQKMDDRNTKRVLTELARSRKELKQIKERYRLADPLDVEVAETRDHTGAVTTTATFLAAERSPPSAPTVEQTVLEVQEHLADNRQLAGRSEVVEELSPKEVLDEKLAVQRALLYVESLHGRPASYRHKDLLRPLYDRYRILKRVVVRSGLSRSKEEVCDLAPILEYEPLELSETRVTQRHSAPPTPSLESMDMSIDEQQQQQQQPCSPRPPTARRHTAPVTSYEKGSASSLWCSDGALVTWKRQKISLNIEENLHALPLNQLVEQMRHVRDEKRRLRRAIRDMEADVLRKQSAVSVQRFDDDDETGDPLEPVYAQYRHARAKLRLLEALVAKHDGSATL